MSLVKMAPSAWRYYAEEISTGKEDYFALGAEHPGRFLGAGAVALGIDGALATAESLERLFGHGVDPRDGALLGRPFSSERSIAGFALTFSPPKSVSALWALGEESTAVEVLSAHEAAVASALSFLERHAAFTRRGHNGILQVDTAGLIAAAFVHRTSRAGDPQLHSHVLVSNKVQAADGAWLALDARELYECQRAAGMLYKAALRAELSARLGCSWTAVDDKGAAEIEGIPAELLEFWSKRRQAVYEEGGRLVAERERDLGRSLRASELAECFQLAAYRTRAPKTGAEVSTTELRSRWREEAVALGHDPNVFLSECLDRRQVAARPTAEQLIPAVINALEERAATFTRADVVEVAASFPVPGRDADELRRHLEWLATQVLRDPEVVLLAAPLPEETGGMARRRDGMAVIERHGAARSSTRRLLALEASVLEAARTGMDAGVGIVPGPLAARALEGRSLGEDQRKAVIELVTGGEQVALLVGPAGAGKSRALEAASAAWRSAGYQVLGLAPSAMAASVLFAEAGIPAETLAKFLTDRTHEPLSETSVVVLDEVGMARTDELAPLVERVRAAGAKLVLVGDPAQLGAVGPGGLFASLVDRHGASELETLRRFQNAFDAEASLRLRGRDPAVLPLYLEAGRIESGSKEQMVDAAVRYWQATREEGKSVLVMTGDNETARTISRRCRAELVAAGLVEEDGVRIEGGVVGVGDEIVTLRNDRALRTTSSDFVRNGARFTVTDRNADGSLVVQDAEQHGSVRLPADYVANHVALAYALTCHKAQGTTVDRAAVVVEEQMTAEQLYVAMSRGREENRALVATDVATPDDHVRRIGADALELLTSVLRHDGAQRSAHDVLRSNLVASEDQKFLRAIEGSVRRAIEEAAGPRPGFELHLLEQRRSERATAKQSFTFAQEEVDHATRELEWAAEELAAAQQRSLLARMPRALSFGAKAEAERKLEGAERVMTRARARMERAITDLEHRRPDFEQALDEEHRLDRYREQAGDRARWEAENPQPMAFMKQVAERAKSGRRWGSEPPLGPEVARRLPSIVRVESVEQEPDISAAPPWIEREQPRRRLSESGYVSGPEPWASGLGGPKLRP